MLGTNTTDRMRGFAGNDHRKFANLWRPRPALARSRRKDYSFGDMPFVSIEKYPVPHYPDIIAAPIRRNGERKQIARKIGHSPTLESRDGNTPDTR